MIGFFVRTDLPSKAKRKIDGPFGEPMVVFILRKEDTMLHCSSTIDHHLLHSCQTHFRQPAPLPQWHLYARRVRWLLAPHASDAGAHEQGWHNSRWLGTAKALLWMAVSIGAGLLIAGLSG